MERNTNDYSGSNRWVNFVTTKATSRSVQNLCSRFDLGFLIRAYWVGEEISDRHRSNVLTWTLSVVALQTATFEYKNQLFAKLADLILLLEIKLSII